MRRCLIALLAAAARAREPLLAAAARESEPPAPRPPRRAGGVEATRALRNSTRESRSHSGSASTRSDATSPRAARDAPSGATPPRLRVYVVGLSKSGTTSVQAMLRALGLAVGKHEATLWRNDGNFTFPGVFNAYDAIVNSAPWNYRDIHRAYPSVPAAAPKSFLRETLFQPSPPPRDIHVVAAAPPRPASVNNMSTSQVRFVVARRSEPKEWLRSAAKHFCFFSWPKADPNYEEFRLTRFAASHFADAYRLFYAGWDDFAASLDYAPVVVDVDRWADRGYVKATWHALAASVNASLPKGVDATRFPHENGRPECCFKRSYRTSKGPALLADALDDAACAEMARSCGVPVVDGDDLAVELLGRPPRPKDDLWSDIFWRKYKYACGVYHESARNHDPARNLLPLHT